MKRFKTFDRPWLILCEGPGDKYVLDKLLRLHGLDAKFFVNFPGEEAYPSGGRGKFAKWLSDRRDDSETFRENVKVVLIVSDNDDSPEDSFKEITKSLKKEDHFGVPTAPKQLAKKQGAPHIVILMIPIGAHGNLETLCVRAALSKWPLTTALDAYVQASPAHTWGLSKQSKMKMQAIIAATCEQDPDTNLANLFQKREEFHVPVNDVVFNEIAQFLREFETFLTTA